MTKKLILLILLAGHCAIAQQNQITKFFPAACVPTGGDANVQSLVSGYILPIGEDLGSLSSGGWYNTAANHKKWGFDLQVTINSITASSDRKSFSPNGLTGVQYDGTALGNNQAPTAYGGEKDFPIFHYTAGLNSGLAFKGPGGGNISSDVPIGSLAVPTITGGLGLFANTDIRFRYTPTQKINGTELSNWGVGVLHDIKQHIPGIKMVPFSLSLLVAYSSQTATTDLSGYYSGTGQQGLGETTATTVQVLISKSIPVLTFYGGIGYNSSTTKYAINGTYLVDNIEGVPLVPTTEKTLTNPFHQDFSTSGFRATGGIRFKFGPIFLNGDYTYFNSKGLVTLGFGITVR